MRHGAEISLTVVTFDDRLNQSEGRLIVDLTLCALHAIDVVIGELTSILVALLECHCLVLFIALYDTG